MLGVAEAALVLCISGDEDVVFALGKEIGDVVFVKNIVLFGKPRKLEALAVFAVYPQGIVGIGNNGEAVFRPCFFHQSLVKVHISIQDIIHASDPDKLGVLEYTFRFLD
jgi:hypothetical protein